MTVAESMKTILGICEFYKVRDYLMQDEKIAVYNPANDNFHWFRWSGAIKRYIFCGSQDLIRNWWDNKIRIR